MVRTHGAARRVGGVALVLSLAFSAPVRAGEAEPLTPEQIAGVMRCMLPQARGEGWHGEELRARYYQPEQLVAYGRAIRRSVEQAGLSERYVAIFVGTLYQQSKFQFDAVSRHNQTEDGERLAPRRDAWRRAQKGMDYGIFQHHWPFPWTPTVPPWNGERKPTLAELKDPLTNILIAGEWFQRKAGMCGELTAKRSSRRACKYDRLSLTCRCLRTREATGEFWVNANPASIGAIMRRIDTCIDEVRAQGET